MTSKASFKDELETVRRLWESGAHAKAFAKIDRLKQQHPGNPHVLVMWSDLLQLQDDDVGPPLEEAKAALERAVELDEHGPMPLIELGHYLYAIDDDTKAAIKCFSKAISLCRRLLRDALLIQSEALSERSRKAEAFACLVEAYSLQSGNGKLANGAAGREILERLVALAKA